ncbi:MAG: TM0106 family RecB-like putative nuclease [Scytonema sp. RU_4_4]|nr:TM0106 family RecB-like putative nuclease [Scytonema sp. RU_4_4]
MLINAELLLQYQRCKRRPFLDAHGDKSRRELENDLLSKLYQDRVAHQMSILTQFTYQQPVYRQGDWKAGVRATLELMQQGAECIYQGVLVSYSQRHILLSRPDLLVKHRGESCFGDWQYFPVSIELGKRPKQEYQVVAAFHAYVLAMVQQSEWEIAWLMLRGKEAGYCVDLLKWMPQMHCILEEYIQTLETDEAPEVFISRQRCNLCPWHNYCYTVAQSQKHLSLLPGVTPVRYTQLQALEITTVESLAKTHPTQLENLPGFDRIVAPKLILQAKSVLENRPFIIPYLSLKQEYIVNSCAVDTSVCLDTSIEIDTEAIQLLFPKDDILFTAPVEIFFDIEAQPDLNLNYLLGVLVVDKQAKTEQFYSFLAENPEEEKLIWQQFLDLVWQYPDAPIYHFCVYEFDTVKRLAKLYQTPHTSVSAVLSRFLDVYEILTQNVALPIESYALKAIARWLGFEWRNPQASGAKCIYWYDEWLKTGDRSLLEIIQRYNEDDCYATRSVKDWLMNFLQKNSGLS